MRKAFLISAACAGLLTACSQADDHSAASEAMPTAATVDAAGAVTDSAEEAPSAAPLTDTLPKLAFAYGLSFELPSNGVGKLMRRHADICEQQGPTSCRVIGMDLSGDAARDRASGRLQLAVAAPHARALTALIEKEAVEADAEQTSATIGSEEVSKAIVDSEARIRSREELRDRLTQVLRTRQGSVKDLVEAERQVAAVNEEIDQARSFLAKTEGRVAFSRMEIGYEAKAAPGSSLIAPIAGVVGSLGSILGFVIAALLALGAVIGPIAALVWAGRRLNRRFGTPDPAS